MNRRALSIASFVFLASLAPSLFGCGGASTDGGSTATGGPSPSPAPAPAETENGVAVPNVGVVRAARVTDYRPQDASHVAAFRDATKIARVIELLGLNGTLTETTAIPNCAPTATVELFDVQGKVTATVSVYCSAGAILQAGDKAFTVPLTDLDALTKLEGDRTLIANWVYEVSKVEIARPLEDKVTVLTTQADIQKAIGAVSAVDTFNPDAPRKKCVADYSVTFTRVVGEGEPIKTHLFVTCGAEPKPSQPGWFQATDGLDGEVVVNAQTIVALANGSANPPTTSAGH